MNTVRRDQETTHADPYRDLVALALVRAAMMLPVMQLHYLVDHLETDVNAAAPLEGDLARRNVTVEYRSRRGRLEVHGTVNVEAMTDDIVVTRTTVVMVKLPGESTIRHDLPVITHHDEFLLRAV